MLLYIFSVQGNCVPFPCLAHVHLLPTRTIFPCSLLDGQRTRSSIVQFLHPLFASFCIARHLYMLIVAGIFTSLVHGTYGRRSIVHSFFVHGTVGYIVLVHGYTWIFVPSTMTILLDARRLRATRRRVDSDVGVGTSSRPWLDQIRSMSDGNVVFVVVRSCRLQTRPVFILQPPLPGLSFKSSLTAAVHAPARILSLHRQRYRRAVPRRTWKSSLTPRQLSFKID